MTAPRMPSTESGFSGALTMSSPHLIPLTASKLTVSTLAFRFSLRNIPGIKSPYAQPHGPRLISCGCHLLHRPQYLLPHGPPPSMFHLVASLLTPQDKPQFLFAYTAHIVGPTAVPTSPLRWGLWLPSRSGWQ